MGILRIDHPDILDFIALKQSPTEMTNFNLSVGVMQAVFQRYSDSGVSKTINLPATATKADVAEAFLLAHQLECKGLTVFRSGSREQQVISCSPMHPC